VLRDALPRHVGAHEYVKEIPLDDGGKVPRRAGAAIT
jgi:hypothetical protein